MNRTDRLHAIHEALRRAGSQGTTAARLADELEISIRTVRRDITALQEGGAPIWAQHGPGGGSWLDQAATLPPVAFTPAQAVAAAVALAALPPGSPFAADARAAAGKLADTLSPEARSRAGTLAGRIWVLNESPEPQAPPTVLRAIERSLTTSVALRLRYRSGRSERSERIVEPVMLAFGWGRWYLVAHCRRRDDLRWFRLDRIDRADATRQAYSPRPVADVGPPPAGAAPVAP